ncbi:MAG: N-acetylmuramoyl-L-alanine amidase [Acidimicrobiia bacterium]|nr:N-acetylmuramoyl-L-alanine amidase [Acidimicrobiia bacterium]
MRFQGDDAPYLDITAFDHNPELDRAVLDALRPPIHPRGDWAADAEPTGLVVAEDDVRFLLVHHTVTDNDYRPDEVAQRIRDVHRLHTGPERGWVDVAYNFLVDRYGGIWEARAGSLERAVQGDASGGSQGFAQLCCLIGNHHQAPPTAEARESLVSLLAWLGHRYRIDTTTGATVEFVSRGSSRWRQGLVVTARTISGHRDMSDTVCPGDYAYPLLERTIPDAVSDRRRQVYQQVAPLVVDNSRQTRSPSSSTTEPRSVAGVPTATIRSESVAADEVGETSGTVSRSRTADDGVDVPAWPLGVTVASGAVAALVALRRRRCG